MLVQSRTGISPAEESMIRFLFSFLTMLVFASAQAQVTGYKENFDDNVLSGWESPNTGTFALAETNGTLRISYNRSAASAEWDNFNYAPPNVGASATPYITLKAKSTLACELTFKPIFVDGGNNWLPVSLPGDNAWHEYTFTLNLGSSTVINRIYMYLDGGTTAAKSGVVYFDDLCLGDSAHVASATKGEELAGILAAATALLQNSTEGTAEAQYPFGRKAVLQAAINKAKSVYEKATASPAELAQAAWDLADACVELEKNANIPNPGLIDPAASPKTKYLYQNLEQSCGKRLLFGMHDATGYGVGWSGDDDRSDVKSVCGDYPALYSWDMNTVDRATALEMSRFMYRIKSAFARGGINTLCWHHYDPKGRSFYGADLPGENIVITLLPGGSNHIFYKNRLTRIARFLKNLRGDDGHAIPIIFRPYHEHDGGAFWWGTNNCSTDEYNRIWQFTVKFLRDSLNVHNLMYAISPINFTTRNEYLKIYPGDDYIDILGMDFYYWAPLDQRQISFFNCLHIPTKLAQERAKIAALTEVGYENLPEPTWFNHYLLPPFKTDSLAEKICYAGVWRNASTTHHFAPYPGHASVPGFLEFYNDSYTAFEQDLPPMYIPPGSDKQPPHFTAQPDSHFVSSQTMVTLYLETDERAHLRYGPEDLNYAQLPEQFQIGQGGFKHSTTIACRQGESRTLFIRAIDLSGNETSIIPVTFKVDTLQRAIPWYDARYPAAGWKTGKAPIGCGAAAGNTTTTAKAKTLYFVTSFDLTQPVSALGLLVKCHDGAMVYLNGEELLRYNMPTGTIGHGTAALSGVKTNQIYIFTPAVLQKLKTGKNTLAIEVHAANLAEADLSLDARVFDQSQMYLNLGGSWRYFDLDQPPPTVTLADFQTGVKNGNAGALRQFELAQNYPNPFNPVTTISFYLSRSGLVRLEVFDITGRLVSTLLNSWQSAGEHKTIFNSGHIASGVYLCRLSAEGQSKVRRMLLLQ
jgi:mannan endo-1,4-beta-mannosidase